MLRNDIRKMVNKYVNKYDTKNPYELANSLGVYIDYDDLGKEFMGYRSYLLRIPTIILNCNNTEQENFETCCHELGHHCCGHDTNTQTLTRQGRSFTLYGVEYEANTFMAELLSHGVNPAEYPTRKCLLRSCGIPDWAERYVDWDYLQETSKVNSCYIYY